MKGVIKSIDPAMRKLEDLRINSFMLCNLKIIRQYIANDGTAYIAVIFNQEDAIKIVEEIVKIKVIQESEKKSADEILKELKRELDSFK